MITRFHMFLRSKLSLHLSSLLFLFLWFQNSYVISTELHSMATARDLQSASNNENNNGSPSSVVTTVSQYAGLGRVNIYGCMFEIHNFQEAKLKLYEVSIHTRSTDENLLVKVYTSPGHLDYLRHPLAWDDYPDMIVQGKGSGVFTTIRSIQFPKIDIDGNSIISMYITLTERALISSKVNSDVNDMFGVATRNVNLGITYGVTKVWPFAEIENAVLFNGGFYYTSSDTLPPTRSPNSTPAPAVEDSSMAPSDASMNVRSSMLNITSTFSGGATNDGVMFDFRAKEKVMLFTMDIITNYIGYVDIEIYFRRSSMSGLTYHPSAWSKIAAFELYGKGYSMPVRIPSGAFEEIILSAGEVCAFYITATNGSFLQLTEYSGQAFDVHEETDHVQMFVGYDKNYPFLHQNKPMAWNGRIYYNIMQTPAPTPIAAVYNKPYFFVCGIDKDDALLCDQPCASGYDTECPQGETCFVNIFPGQCRNMNFCGVSLNDAKQCSIPCLSGSDLDCPSGETCFTSISAIDCNTMNYCGVSIQDAKSCSYPCPSGDSSDCPNGSVCWLNIPSIDCNNNNFCAASEELVSSCNQKCPSGSDSDCLDNEKCFSTEIDIDCNDQGYDDDIDSTNDPSSNFFCGVDRQDATSCSVSCGVTGLDSECPVGQQCFSNVFPGQCKTMKYCGVDRSSAANSCNIACPNGNDNECPSGQSCFDDIAAIECETMNYCGISSEASVSCAFPCPSGSSYECPTGMACFLDILASECKVLNYCGSSSNDVYQCNKSCPSGSDDECPVGESCFLDISSRQCNSMNFCGVSLVDAQSCGTPCQSGSADECPTGESCFTNILPSDCTDLFYCGDTAENASQCNTPCPNGLDSECPGNQHCFHNVLNTECMGTNYCGTSFEGAQTCSIECPSGSSTDCPSGETCFLNISPGLCKSMRFCGKSRPDASQCNYPCPSGRDNECPINQYCFDDIAASKCELMNFCGASYEDASSCNIPCPSGTGFECPTGQACYRNISSTECRNNRFCGKTRGSATSCSLPCPTGLDIECPDEMTCFSDIRLIDCQEMNFCGIDFDDARNCGFPCPSGSDLECPIDETCFLNIYPAECKNLNFCGEARESATQCNYPCPSGSNFECPDNQKCFSNIAARDCEVMHFCGFSAEATQCSIPCVPESNKECPLGQSCVMNVENSQCPSDFSIDTFDILCIAPLGQVDVTSNLVTTFDGDSATYGNMFDVFAIKSIIVMGIDVHISNVGDTEVELYVTCCKLDSYGDVMRHPTAWTKFYSGIATGKGPGLMTYIPSTDMEPTCIPKGRSKGFYMTVTEGRYMLQTKSSKISGDVYISNEDLILFVGVGKTYRFMPGKEKNMVWNGQISYIVLDDERQQETFSISSGRLNNTYKNYRSIALTLAIYFLSYVYLSHQ